MYGLISTSNADFIKLIQDDENQQKHPDGCICSVIFQDLCLLSVFLLFPAFSPRVLSNLRLQGRTSSSAHCYCRDEGLSSQLAGVPGKTATMQFASVNHTYPLNLIRHPIVS